MMIDKELFDLCKQVYEATGWPQELNISQLYEYWDDHDELCVISIEDSDDELVPSYTSDYLLEKLPKEVKKTVRNGRNGSKGTTTRGQKLSLEPRFGDWFAGYKGTYAEIADTPLKSLLLLTLKLHEEKLL